MLQQIKNLPHSIVRNIDGIDNLVVYTVQDFNLKLLNEMVNFGLDAFGEEMYSDEWSLVPQIRHGNVYAITEKNKFQIVGLAILMRDWEDVDKVYLFDYAISEDFQGMGIGFEFFKIISEDLGVQGFKRISLTVDADNKPAMRLYRNKIGFKSVDYSRNEYGEGHDRYILELNIEEFLNSNVDKKDF